MWMGAQVQLSHPGKHTQKGRLPRTAASTEASRILPYFFSHDLPHFPAETNPLRTERKPSWKNGCSWLWSATSKVLLIIKETFILCSSDLFQVPLPPLQFWLGRKQESISDMDILISVYPSTSMYLSWGFLRKSLYFMATISRSNLQGDLDSFCSLGSRFVYLGTAVCLFLWQSHHLKDHLSW